MQLGPHVPRANCDITASGWVAPNERSVHVPLSLPWQLHERSEAFADKARKTKNLLAEWEDALVKLKQSSVDRLVEAVRARVTCV